jgi:plastocyanin
MRRMLALLAIGVATVSALAASAGAAPPSVQVLIRHQVRGCHSWSVNNNAFAATQRLTVVPGTRFAFTDNDVMSHQIVQLSGPKLTLHNVNMHTIGAHTTLQLFAKGHYVFGTKAGEDYMKGVKTTGEDNALKLVVTVK